MFARFGHMAYETYGDERNICTIHCKEDSSCFTRQVFVPHLLSVYSLKDTSTIIYSSAILYA